MTKRSHNHPADNLAMALERASGLLTTITDLYDADRERFAGGEAFAVHAVSTVAAMVTEAKNALADMHYSCDLTMLDQPPESSPVVDFSRVRDANYESAPTTVDRVEKSFQETPEFVAQPAATEEFAQSYLELLNKLTAAEIFASEQQALSAPGAQSDLLPLLKSLREDLQRIHSAA